MFSLHRFGDHPKHFQFVLRRTDVRQPVNPTRTRSPVPTSHHHRRVSSNAGHYATFQNAATAYNQPKGHNYRRPEDKEVAAAFADRNSEQEAAELQKHSNVDWSKCYEEANQRYLALIDSRRSLQLKLRDLDANLRQSRGNVQELESEMAGALTKLLNLVEEALEVRRKTVSELSLNPETTLPPPPLPPTQANSTKAPACDEVLI
ncbi:unnamed protein product [Rodentolepis nana]|uniref:Uncharacterized protein n=1 Tax=Rodentolepis nana TaxID=102285 RepID=A0A3P7RU36_RODNA|nr:unnamed protein product [Rodentolepis nana]